MPSYSPEDVGGGWILSNPADIATGSCPIAATPTNTTPPIVYSLLGVALGAFGVIVAYTIIGGNKHAKSR